MIDYISGTGFFSSIHQQTDHLSGQNEDDDDDHFHFG